MFNITIMDQYSSAILPVPANLSSVEINKFPYNHTSIVANREYTITVSAISDQGMSCPSDPVVIGKCQVCVHILYLCIPIHLCILYVLFKICMFCEILLAECCIQYRSIITSFLHACTCMVP